MKLRNILWVPGLGSLDAGQGSRHVWLICCQKLPDVFLPEGRQQKATAGVHCVERPFESVACSADAGQKGKKFAAQNVQYGFGFRSSA